MQCLILSPVNQTALTLTPERIPSLVFGLDHVPFKFVRVSAQAGASPNLVIFLDFAPHHDLASKIRPQGSSYSEHIRIREIHDVRRS